MRNPRTFSAPGRLLSIVGVVFITAWAVRSGVVTGAALLNEHPGALLRGSPAAAQSAVREAFAQGLLKINQRIPAHASVMVLWEVKGYAPFSYAFFWSTFWLYPRKVTVTDRPDDALSPTTDVFVQVHSADQQPLSPTGYRVVSDDSGPALTITTYERSS